MGLVNKLRNFNLFFLKVFGKSKGSMTFSSGPDTKIQRNSSLTFQEHDLGSLMGSKDLVR